MGAKYHIIRHVDGSYRYEGTAEKSEVPPSDSHCFYIPALAEYGEPFEGAVLDSLNKRFVANGASNSRVLTQYQFMSRLGFPAITDIRAAAKTDVEIESAWEFARAAEYVDLDEPMTATLLSLLAQKGVFTAADVEIVLDGGSL
jgi:hypothetical protein